MTPDCFLFHVLYQADNLWPVITSSSNKGGVLADEQNVSSLELSPSFGDSSSQLDPIVAILGRNTDHNSNELQDRTSSGSYLYIRNSLDCCVRGCPGSTAELNTQAMK